MCPEIFWGCLAVPSLARGACTESDNAPARKTGSGYERRL